MMKLRSLMFRNLLQMRAEAFSWFYFITARTHLYLNEAQDSKALKYHSATLAK